MLTDQVRQLLTAYVDGELTNRQRKALARLLHRSPEARALLRQLQEDAASLRALPRPRLGADFTARVVRAVRQRQVQQHQQAARQASAGWPALAAAAAVVLAVGLGSFLYFARPPAGDPLAQLDQPPADTPPGQDPADGRRTGSVTEVTPRPSDSAKEPPKPEPVPMPPVVADKPNDPVRPDVPGVEKVFTSPEMEMFKPVVVQPPFALLEDLHALRADDLRKKIDKEAALRLELPCRDTAKGFHRVQAALKDVGIGLAIDAAAQNRLDKPRLKSNYVLLVEDLTAEELARALAKLGSEDRKAAEAKPKPDGQFSRLVVNRLSDTDFKELSAVLHVEQAQLQNGPDRPGKGSERLALAVTYNPERPKPNSPEVKRYLDSRKPARPGTLRVLLVLREAS
jgi:anti-sigma-K factor RskA